MQHRLLSLLATLGVAVAVLVAVPVSAQAAPQAVRSAKAPASMNGLEDRLLTEINQARSANGLEAIRSVDACTDRLAEQWGQRIARTGLFEHRDQNEVIEKCDNSWAGETLVRGSGLTPAAMVQLWLDSPGHRAILLSPRARRAGIAITRDPQGRMIGVVNMVRHR
ncbi:uncharacterized protein YkwD [Nocardioides sp. BE266]|uniref:CAP domain-containing protein n=1 Tax=Nocardioides sp. BE266 TaxID=2817725 RepID=UPI0028649726|nr:CAP domain-containing protein [Nocardioides sp. BE266]MDR7254096.1 uncharacterized protein YkwD [Nocardioides sp. BE266]